MSEYDGLSLSQLLDRLLPLAVPEPVSWIPQTSGWWVVGCWMVAVALLGCWDLRKRRQRNRYRREALSELDNIKAGVDFETGAQIKTGAPPLAASAADQIAKLLKRTALAAYPRERVASLTGADWAAFLVESANQDPLVAGYAGQLAGAAYHAHVDAAALIPPARRWIELHRV